MPAADESDKSKSRKSRKFFLIIFRILVASFILFLIFRKIPISEVGSAMGQTNVPYAVVAFLMAFLVHIGASFRLKQLCEFQNIRLPAIEIFKINTASRFYSLFLPGGNFTGIAIRFYRLSVLKKKYTEAIFAMLCDRIFATITLCVVGAFFWIIELPKETQSYFKLMLIFLIGLGIILMLMAFIKPASALSAMIGWLGRIKFGKFRLSDGSTDYQPQLPAADITRLFLLSCFLHILGIFSYYLICVALGLDLSLVTIGWIRSAVILATMIPVSVSGVGLREGAMVILLNNYHIPPQDALAFSFIIFSITVFGIGIIGGIFEAARLLK
jgi:uncharacterized protein (TIRG00374 family)